MSKFIDISSLLVIGFSICFKVDCCCYVCVRYLLKKFVMVVIMNNLIVIYCGVIFLK